MPKEEFALVVEYVPEILGRSRTLTLEEAEQAVVATKPLHGALESVRVAKRKEFPSPLPTPSPHLPLLI